MSLPGVASCTVFGTPGQSQFGADLKSDLLDSKGIEIGQCKREKAFAKGKIQQASQEFLDYWDSYWRERGVSTFRLFVACELHQTSCIEQSEVEKKKFESLGIRYETWPASRITNELRRSRAVVTHYFGEAWASIICGEPQTITVASNQSAISSNYDQMASLLTGFAEQSLGEIKALWREGKKIEAARRIETLCGDPEHWTVLSPAAQAKILRFRAVIAIERTDSVEAAKKLAAQAKALALDPQDLRIEALIANAEEDSNAAISILGSVSDKDSLNLRAVLQLQASLLNECDETIRELDRLGLADEETDRVRALLCLAKGDIPAAQLAAQGALDAQPTWESMRIVHAIVGYYSALSPAALELPASLSIPNPVDWAFVKTDSDSLERLRDAHSNFLDAANNEDHDRTRRRALQTWSFACLANDFERQEEARTYLTEVLNVEPSHPFAVMWCLARGYPFNKARSEASLKVVVGDGSSHVEDILALVGCLVSQNHPRQARRLLKKYKAQFGASTENAIWRHWYSQTLSLEGDASGALAVLDDSPQQVHLNETRVIAIRNQCRLTKHWIPLVELLTTLYGETRSSRFLYELCELHMHLKDWPAAAALASDLIRNVRTGEACRLAAHALFRDNRFKECLEALESSDHDFPSGRLPYDLGRLRLECLRQMGSIVEAREEANKLVQEEQSTTSLLDLVNTHLSFGDYAGIVSVGHVLLVRSDLTAEQALRLGWLVRLENGSLAAALWDRANRLGIPDDAVVPAWLLGAHLGKQKQLGPLTVRLEKLAANGLGGVQRVSLDALPSMMKRWSERATELNAAYESASVPVHMLAKEGGAVLAQLFHLSFSRNGEVNSGLSKAPLLFRHGGRPLIAPFAGKLLTRRLILDITSFLLAFHFDLLEPVELAFKQVWISPSLVPALQAMRDRLVSRQPDVVDDWKRIVKLVDSGRLQVVPRGGEVHSITRIEVCHGIDSLESRVTVDDVIGALHATGDLPRETDVSLVNRGIDGSPKDGATTLKERSELLFVGTAIESLAHAGVLELTTDRFDVAVEDLEVVRLRSELSDLEQREELGRWLGRCIEHLRLGLETRTYKLLAVPHPGLSEHESSSEMACLLSLLHPNELDDSVVWIDDRWANSHTSINKSLIVDSVQILWGLRESGHLSDAQYFQSLLKMRSAGILFIPLDAEEILFYMNQAAVVDGRVVETHGLRTLRQYEALCLEMGRVFQRPLPELTLPNPKGEVDFLIDLHRAAVEAIARCWQGPTKDSGARAEWLLENLYVDLAGLSVLARWRDSEAALFHLTTVSLAGLITRGLTLVGDGTKSNESRRRYLDWLRTSLLEPRFASNPLLVQSVSEFVKRTLADLVPKTAITPEEVATVMVLQGYFEALPSQIRQELARDVSFIRPIGIRVFRAAHFGDLSFESSDFYRALRTALNGKPTVLKTVSSEMAVTIRPCCTLNRKAAVAVTHPISGDLYIGADESMGLLSDSVHVRQDLLREHREWFDLPRREFESATADIATTKNLESRMEKLRERQSASAANFYRNLKSVLRLKDALHQPDVLPPATDDLLRHLRIENGTNTLDWAIEESAARLIEDEGLLVALDRLAGLPCPLPETLIRHFIEGDHALRRSFIDRLLALRGSPIARAHLCHLVGRLPDYSECHKRTIGRRLMKFIDVRAEAEFRALKSILNWTYHEIVNRADSDKYHPHLLLLVAWYHAHKLLLAMRAIRARYPWVEEVFPRLPQRLPKEIFERNLDRWLDVCHPTRVTWELFGLGAFHYACAGRHDVSVTGNVRTAIQEFAFLEQDGRLRPKPAFIVANELGCNRLASFLGGDPFSKLNDLVDPETATALKVFRDVTGIEPLMNRLEDPESRNESWPLLAHVLGSFSLPANVKPRLLELLMTTDFGLLVQNNRDVGLIALFEAAVQALNLRDPALVTRLQSELEKVAQILARTESSDRSERDGLILIEAAVNLSLSASPPGSAMASFASFARRIVDQWPAVAKWLSPLVSTFQRDLPISQSSALWPLTIRIRGA